jgi:hypothetical protein
MLAVKECISGVSEFYYATPPFMADEIDVWYDVYVQLEDDTAAIYSAARGAFGVQNGRTAAPDRVVPFVAFVPSVAKKIWPQKAQDAQKKNML